MVQLLIKKTNQPENLEKSIGDWFRRLFGGTKRDKKTVFKKTSPVSHMFPDLYSEPITEKPLLYKKNDQGIMEATLSKQEHDEWEKLIKKVTDGFFRRKVNEHFNDSEKSDKWIRQSLGSSTERQDVARSKKIIQDFLEKIIPAHKVQIPSSIESPEDYLKKLFTEEQQKSIYDMIPDLPMKAKFPEILPNEKADTIESPVVTESPVVRNAWNDTQSRNRATDAKLVPEDFQGITPTGRAGAWSLADVDAAIARKNAAVDAVIARKNAAVVTQSPVVAQPPTSVGFGQSLPSPIRTPRVLTDSERRGLNSNYDSTLGSTIHDFIDRFIAKVVTDADESGDSFQTKTFILEKLKSLSANAKSQPKGMSGIPAADFAIEFWKLCNSKQFNDLNIGKTKTEFQTYIEDSFLREKRQIEIESPLNQKWSEGDITEVLPDDKQSEKITKHPRTGKDEALIVEVFRPQILQNGKQIIAPSVALGKIPSLQSSIDPVSDQGNSGISDVERTIIYPRPLEETDAIGARAEQAQMGQPPTPAQLSAITRMATALNRVVSVEGLDRLAASKLITSLNQERYPKRTVTPSVTPPVTPSEDQETGLGPPPILRTYLFRLVRKLQDHKMRNRAPLTVEEQKDYDAAEQHPVTRDEITEMLRALHADRGWEIYNNERPAPEDEQLLEQQPTVGSRPGTYPREYTQSLLGKVARGESITDEETQILINEGLGSDMRDLEMRSKRTPRSSVFAPPTDEERQILMDQGRGPDIRSDDRGSAATPAEPTSVTPTNHLPFEMTINVNKSKEEFKKFGQSIADYATISRIKTNGSNQTHQISYQPEHYDKILEEMLKHPTLNSQAILFEKHGVGPVKSPEVVSPTEISPTPAKEDEADDFF